VFTAKYSVSRICMYIYFCGLVILCWRFCLISRGYFGDMCRSCCV